MHRKYQDLENWKGRETADFVYTDQDGVLTQYLRTNCFGDFPILHRGIEEAFQPIEYFIEVKTTPLTCDTRFFMSKWQYKRVSLSPRNVLCTLLIGVPVDGGSSNQTGRTTNADLCHHSRLQPDIIRHQHVNLR